MYWKPPNCFRYLDESDMRESGDKLGSRKYETLRYNLCGEVDPRRRLKEPGFNLERLFIE
jgi:hypothetical protein